MLPQGGIARCYYGPGPKSQTRSPGAERHVLLPVCGTKKKCVDILTLRLAHSSTQVCAIKLNLALKAALPDRALGHPSQPRVLAAFSAVKRP